MTISELLRHHVAFQDAMNQDEAPWISTTAYFVDLIGAEDSGELLDALMTEGVYRHIEISGHWFSYTLTNEPLSPNPKQ